MKHRNLPKAFALIAIVLFTVTAYSQNTINNYKYVLVPEKFGFLKAENQYGLNSLTKMLLQEKGFTVFVGNEALPAELNANRCNALIADVTEKGGLLVTKLTLLLKDCQGNIIFRSKEGKSREKEFQAAYDLALRDAFTTLNELPYKYDGSSIVAQAPQPAVTPAVPAAPPAPATPSITDATGVLYAQATPNGFQLIDTSPKKVLTLLKTSMQDYFIAVDGTATGVAFKKNEEWFFEYYKDNKLVSHKLQIKF